MVIGCKEHADWAKECADKAITLVKDNQKLLPISPARTKESVLPFWERKKVVHLEMVER